LCAKSFPLQKILSPRPLPPKEFCARHQSYIYLSILIYIYINILYVFIDIMYLNYLNLNTYIIAFVYIIALDIYAIDYVNNGLV
jgi:hypothetical protein